jgi:hypothetical protein
MSNDDFLFLRKFKDIQIFSEEEKKSILLAKNSEIVNNVLKKETGIPHFFINNILSYSLMNNGLHMIYSSDYFSEKSLDEYMIAASLKPKYAGELPRNHFFIYNESSDSYEDGQPSYLDVATTISSNCHIVQYDRGPGFRLSPTQLESFQPEIKSNVSYKDTMFAFMIDYRQKEEVISLVDKIFADILIAISSCDNNKASGLFQLFRKELSLGFSDISMQYHIGISDCGSLFLKIKEMFSMLSSKMIYFDIAGDCERSQSLTNLSKTCFDIIKNYCGFINGEKFSDAHARLFKNLLAKRGVYNYNVDFRAAQDPFISVMVELAFIYAEKNNLDLISTELLEKVFAGNLSLASHESPYFSYAVVYSTSIRDNKHLNTSLSPKSLRKTLVEQRKILYIAAINSGNLNKNLIARLAVEKCDIFHEVGASLIVSRFLYLKSKAIREMSHFKWSEISYKMCIGYLYLLRKKDFASLFTINLDISNFKYTQYFNYCKSYLVKKISVFEK